jgi:hypothetical protein
MGKLAVFAFCLCVVSAAIAQAPQVIRVRGTVAAVDGRVVTVKTRQGEQAKITLSDGASLVAPKKIGLADIKPGSFIGTAAVPSTNGELQSLEVVVFPESMRGTGEGHYAWDLKPDSTMTNANVDAVVKEKSGRELQLSYKGGTTKVIVPPKAPIVTPVPANLSDFKPGAKVMIIASKGPDGSLTSARAWVEKNGVAPPM